MKHALESLASSLGDHIDNLILFDRVDSTHAAALRIIEQLDEEGLSLRPTLLVAKSQSRGRGRGDRHWTSPEGGLYLNWVRAGLEKEVIALLPILAAAAALAAAARIGVSDAAIKWPNDLLVRGAKLAGLLVHARHGDPSWATVGLGINILATPVIQSPGSNPIPATSISEHLPAAEAAQWAERITTAFVEEFSGSLTDPEPALVLWRDHLVHRPGEPMTVRLGSGEVESGTFAGITPDGFIRLRQGEQERVITSGDVIER